MRRIDLIVFHCSDSDRVTHDNIETLREWHIYERGWSDVGYHYVITKDGKLHIGRNLHTQGAHVKGHNKNSIGICLTGRNEFSQAQFDTAKKVVDELMLEFGLSPIDVVAHNELDKGKTCPNFNIYTKIMGNLQL